MTKKIHNALQGQYTSFSKKALKLYLKTNEMFSKYTHINHDLIIVHDPQPLPLINFYKKNRPWINRIHIDISQPTPILEYLKKYIIKYDKIIISSEDYIMKDFPVDTSIIAPAINPYSLKNIDIKAEEIKKCLKTYNIPIDKPIITQISRFDIWKNPKGVLKVFEKVKQKIDCRLILCGSMASDDPEGILIYEDIKKEAKDWIKKGDVILTTIESDILVNSLQRISDVVIQFSNKEGFGLTITEAMLKSKPVIGTTVGGIPLQITDGKNGYLVSPGNIQQCADKVIEILKNPKLARKIGENARKTVIGKFLIIRLLENYLDLMIDILK